MKPRKTYALRSGREKVLAEKIYSGEIAGEVAAYDYYAKLLSICLNEKMH